MSVGVDAWVAFGSARGMAFCRPAPCLPFALSQRLLKRRRRRVMSLHGWPPWIICEALAGGATSLGSSSWVRSLRQVVAVCVFAFLLPCVVGPRQVGWSVACCHGFRRVAEVGVAFRRGRILNEARTVLEASVVVAEARHQFFGWRRCSQRVPTQLAKQSPGAGIIVVCILYQAGHLELRPRSVRPDFCATFLERR